MYFIIVITIYNGYISFFLQLLKFIFFYAPSTNKTTGLLTLFSIRNLLKMFPIYSKKVSDVIHPESLRPSPHVYGILSTTFFGFVLKGYISIGGTIFPAAEKVDIQVMYCLTSPISISKKFSDPFSANTVFDFGLRSKFVSSSLKSFSGNSKDTLNFHS